MKGLHVKLRKVVNALKIRKGKLKCLERSSITSRDVNCRKGAWKVQLWFQCLWTTWLSTSRLRYKNERRSSALLTNVPKSREVDKQNTMEMDLDKVYSTTRNAFNKENNFCFQNWNKLSPQCNTQLVVFISVTTIRKCLVPQSGKSPRPSTCTLRKKNLQTDGRRDLYNNFVCHRIM